MAKIPLSDAFRATQYRVWLAGRWYSLEVNARAPRAIQAWLASHANSGPAWLITAHNPGAAALPARINRARGRALRAWVQAHAASFLDSVNRDPRGVWPDEAGQLIAGVEEGLARSVARRFGQLALLAVRARTPVEIVWLDRPSPRAP